MGDPVLGATTLFWSADVEKVEVRVGSPAGSLFASGAGQGSARTGDWVSDGMPFFLVEPGTATTPPSVLGSVTVRVEVGWPARQGMMERYYEDLAAGPPQRRIAAQNADHQPLRRWLRNCRGTLLDLGGGSGALRQHLPESVDYVCLDPSVVWRRSELRPRELKPTGTEILGVGEFLPFLDETFDTITALYSLNHVESPSRSLAEAFRVLKPGGLLKLALEDMEPSWTDVLSAILRGRHLHWVRHKLGVSREGRAWPLQSDHVRIHEAELNHWIGKIAAVERRSWIGVFLTLDIRKL